MAEIVLPREVIGRRCRLLMSHEVRLVTAADYEGYVYDVLEQMYGWVKLQADAEPFWIRAKRIREIVDLGPIPAGEAADSSGGGAV